MLKKLRHEAAVAFGVTVSVDCNITYDSSGKHLVATALEKLSVWHVRQGICTKALAPSPSSLCRGSSLAVSSIATSQSSLLKLLVSKLSADDIYVQKLKMGNCWWLCRWYCKNTDAEKGTCETTPNGHRSAVTILRYKQALDSYLLLELKTVTSFYGLFRLQGLRDKVTDLVFLDTSKKLVSSWKDKFLRVWDLETQHCVHIVSGHHSEIWSVDINPSERYLVSGLGDPERFYSTNNDAAGKKLAPEKIESDVDNINAYVRNKWEIVKHFGDIQRQSNDRVSTVQFSKSGNLLACQVVGTKVEIFSCVE